MSANPWHPWANREQVAAYIASTGSNQSPEEFMAEAAAGAQSFERQHDERIASAVWSALDSGGYQAPSGEFVELASPMDAVELLAANDEAGAAALVLEKWKQQHEAETEQQTAEWLRTEATPFEAITHLQSLSAEKQAAALAERQAALQDVATTTLSLGIETAKQYAAGLPEPVVQQALKQFAGKIIASSDVPDDAATDRLARESVRESALAHDRLLELTDQAETEWRIRAKADMKTGPALTSSEYNAAKQTYIANRVAQLSEERQITPEEAALPKTGAEIAAEERARAEARLASESKARLDVGGIAARAMKPGEYRLSERFSARHSEHDAYKAAVAAAEETAGTPVAIRTAYAGSTPGAVVVNEDASAPPPA